MNPDALAEPPTLLPRVEKVVCVSKGTGEHKSLDQMHEGGLYRELLRELGESYPVG